MTLSGIQRKALAGLLFLWAIRSCRYETSSQGKGPLRFVHWVTEQLFKPQARTSYDSVVRQTVAAAALWMFGQGFWSLLQTSSRAFRQFVMQGPSTFLPHKARDGYLKAVLNLVFPCLLRIPGVPFLVDKEVRKEMAAVEQRMFGEGDKYANLLLPYYGRTCAEVVEHVKELQNSISLHEEKSTVASSSPTVIGGEGIKARADEGGNKTEGSVHLEDGEEQGGIRTKEVDRRWGGIYYECQEKTNLKEKDISFEVPPRGSAVSAETPGAPKASEQTRNKRSESTLSVSQLQTYMFGLFNGTNALYPNIFPLIRKFEAEVITMVVGLLHGEETSRSSPYLLPYHLNKHRPEARSMARSRSRRSRSRSRSRCSSSSTSFPLSPSPEEPVADGALIEDEYESVDDVGDPESKAVGLLTSGGTESILVCILSYRELAKARGITHPEIIACETAHPACFKACHYFGIRLITVDPDPVSLRMTQESVAAVITSSTIAVYCSAPSFPHG